ncbi:uncharacterized protein LOC106661208 isoform X2 [Cimex lectularius]|nr:uncharacterized protein LOC106661208 isoform X2 [Cimex lectularius]XP_014239951.1 uncharacterized protein LOC106661208 isoform X2 [Cimex lectularius]XP_014239952.1 uncharacterized protein LOC106661208 isoform X2 [Cimex lectularius]
MEEKTTTTTTTTTTTNSTTNNNAAEAKPTEKSAEQIRIEFYKTYDVMTGVRIAATLGGFFSLMVLLVVYKTKCKSRSISEENLEATVAAAVVEEEQFAHSLEKAHEFYTPHIPIHGFHAKRPTRFSSVGGGYNMFTPPVRLGHSLRGRVSLPTSSPYVYPTIFQPRHLIDSPPPKVFREDEEDFESYRRSQNLLRVPSSRRSSRRLSSITCSSCDTSYLERRGSAIEMGRPIPPPFVTANKDRLVEEEPWDFYYPIDIQVIQPTPVMSPAESQVLVYDSMGQRPMLCVPRSSATAPLASISSCRLPSIEQDSHSVGSDSVFLDEELVDTEDEVDEFSTDSDADNLECNIPSKPSEDGSKNIPLCSKPLKDHSRVYRVPTRRFSSPNSSKMCGVSYFQQADSANDNKRFFSSSRLAKHGKNSYKTSSDSDTIHVNRLDKQLSSNGGQMSKNIPRTSMSASCDHLVKALQEHSSQGDVTLKVVEHCTWSQETLF